MWRKGKNMISRKYYSRLHLFMNSYRLKTFMSLVGIKTCCDKPQIFQSLKVHLVNFFNHKCWAEVSGLQIMMFYNELNLSEHKEILCLDKLGFSTNQPTLNTKVLLCMYRYSLQLFKFCDESCHVWYHLGHDFQATCSLFGATNSNNLRGTGKNTEERYKRFSKIAEAQIIW